MVSKAIVLKKKKKKAVVCVCIPVYVFPVCKGRWETDLVFERNMENMEIGNMLSKYCLLYWFTDITVCNCDRAYVHSAIVT